MAQQGLMCVWQTLSGSHPRLQGEACEKGVLRTLTANFYRLAHTRGSVSVFDDVFRDNDVISLEQYYTFVNDHLRDSSYAMCLLEDEIEQVCWELSREVLQEEGYETRLQLLKQLWQIFGRLSEIGSLPPVLQSSEREWLLKKLKLDVSISKTDLTFIQFLEVIDINGIQQSDKIESLQKKTDSVHSWMVREVLMTGWMWKRTRKQANWTTWLKRWFVLTPGQLAYYDGPKLKDRKGAVDITTRTSVTELPDTRRFGWRLTGCFGLENRPFLQVELSTMDEAEKGAWMTALMEVKGAVQEGSTPMKRVLSRRLKSGQKSNLLELPFMMRPRSKSPIAPMVRPPSSKMKKLKCTNCNEGVRSRRHISLKEPVLQRRLRKMASIPEDQKQKIRNIFFSIDKDGNGKIDREEFSQFLHKLGLEMSSHEVDLIFESIQGKQNGKITMEGFYIYFVKTILHESTSTCAEQQLRAAFLDADRNQTGTINFREFVEYVWERRRSIRISRVLRTFEEMDKDGNGEVEYGDFMDFLRHDPSFCEELSLNKSSDETTDSSDDHGGDDEDNNNEDSGDLLSQAEELQRVLYEDESTDDPKVMVDFLKKRWNAFVSFKRPGASGDIVMKGKSGLISDVLPGEYSLLDLAAFSDLPPLIPKHAHLTNVVWESADMSDSNSHGRVIFPAEFDGVIPVQIATTELLRFYGCSLANADTVTVSLMYRHAIQDFTYENQYIKEFVANTKKQAGAGMEKHDFSHLDMPLDDAGGHMVLAKLEDGEMHLTAFVVPTRHCLYLPGGVLHTNDYLKGTWRTMLSDEAPIDHCHITRRSDTAEGGVEKFLFTFK